MRRKDIDEMELSFEEINKKPIGKIIFFILLLLLLIGGCCYYYFVFDSPKRIFLTSANKLIEKFNYEEKGLTKDFDYKLDMNMISNDNNNQEIKTYLDLINQITIEGYHRTYNDINQENMLINYKDKLLLDLSLLLKDEENTYIKVNNLYDKVIHLPLEELVTEEENEETSIDVTIDDYKVLINSLKKHITDVMKNANYKKTYTKLNDNYVKKVTLLCDKELYSSLYDKLINDSEFIKSYAKINSQTEEEVIDELNEEISLLTDDVNELSLYLTIFDNKFIMLEEVTKDDYFKVEFDGNKYYYELTEDNNLLTKGYIEYQKTNDNNYLKLSIEDTKEKLIIEADVEYTFNTKNIEKVDITNSIKYEEITEPELIKIMTSLTENEAFKLLIDDLGLSSYLTGTTNQGI